MHSRRVVQSAVTLVVLLFPIRAQARALSLVPSKSKRGFQILSSDPKEADIRFEFHSESVVSMPVLEITNDSGLFITAERVGIPFFSPMRIQFKDVEGSTFGHIVEFKEASSDSDWVAYYPTDETAGRELPIRLRRVNRNLLLSAGPNRITLNREKARGGKTYTWIDQKMTSKPIPYWFFSYLAFKERERKYLHYFAGTSALTAFGIALVGKSFFFRPPQLPSPSNNHRSPHSEEKKNYFDEDYTFDAEEKKAEYIRRQLNKCPSTQISVPQQVSVPQQAANPFLSPPAAKSPPKPSHKNLPFAGPLPPFPEPNPFLSREEKLILKHLGLQEFRPGKEYELSFQEIVKLEIPIGTHISGVPGLERLRFNYMFLPSGQFGKVGYYLLAVEVPKGLRGSSILY